MTKVEFIQQQTQLNNRQIENTLNLFTQGATIPFIARYRKEATLNMDELQIAEVQNLANTFDELIKRKTFVLEAIREKGKLTDLLEQKITDCYDLLKLEDLYLPFKTKRLTKAEKAIKAGLSAMAAIIMKQENGDPKAQAERFRGVDYTTVDAVLEGALEIVANWINENEIVREKLRASFFEHGVLTTKVVKSNPDKEEKYKDYYDSSQRLINCPAHRFLAALRAENEGVIKVKIESNTNYCLEWLQRLFIKNNNDYSALVEKAIVNSYKKLLQPSLESETKNYYKQKADDQSIQTFSKNLEKLLLAPPLGNKAMLAIDPGFKSGCKVVVLDDKGNLKHNTTIYPHPPQKEISAASSKIAQLVEMYKADVIAIGDGTAGRETEFFLKKIRFPKDISVFIVREDGASVYSASKVAREEFPDYDVTVRGAVSIGRRLMDPLAELVKIDPKSLGIGQYQHDVNQTKLQHELDRVVISAVNKVGVDLNTASKYLLSYVSGLGPKLAENIVLHRQKNGLFKSRNDLLNVTRMGDKAYQQAAGFLRIRNANHPLDNSAVHPEHYLFVENLVKKSNLKLQDVIANKELIQKLKENSVNENQIGEFTLNDILQELEKPGIDPRSSVKNWEFSQDVKKIEDLKTGMKLNGIVTNVTDFGAFVNIGIKENGLIHKTQICDHFINHPSEILSLHQQVKVMVYSVDNERKRIGLTLKF